MRLSIVCVLAMAYATTIWAGPPVVVLIVGDDLGYAELGCYLVIASSFHTFPSERAIVRTVSMFEWARLPGQ